MAFPNTEELTRTHTTLLAKNSPKPKLTSASTRQPRVKPKAGPPIMRTRVRRVSKLVSPRPGSKTSKVLALLERPRGASLKELLKATGWQPHSMRGFLSGIVTKKMGLKVKSIKSESGERRYAVNA